MQRLSANKLKGNVFEDPNINENSRESLKELYHSALQKLNIQPTDCPKPTYYVEPRLAKEPGQETRWNWRVEVIVMDQHNNKENDVGVFWEEMPFPLYMLSTRLQRRVRTLQKKLRC